MIDLRAGLRKRPCLPGCLMMTGAGLSLVAIDLDMKGRFGHVFFWAGIAAIPGALVLAVGYEIGYRRKRAGHRANP